MGLRIGGALVCLIGLILAVSGFISFFSSFNDAMHTDPDPYGPLPAGPGNFWMAFVGMPLVIVGLGMLGWGFLGTTTRYATGEVAPTVKDTLDYVGFGLDEAKCAKCDATNPAGAKFCDHCGSALSTSCASCGHTNAADSAFCSACGKPLPAS